jgi:transposase
MEGRMKKTEFVVGVDVGDESLSVAATKGADGSGLLERSVRNELEGFEELREWLSEHKVTADNAVFCLEATGVYGEALCYYLSSRGFRVAVEPPVKVKRAFAQSAHKNDTVDARQIAEYGHRFYDELSWWTPPAAVLEQVRVLLSAREQFTGQKIANVNALKALQRKTITTRIAIQAYEQTIARLTENIKDIDQEIKRLVKKDDSFNRLITTLTSTPGIGMLLAANLVVMTNGFTRTANHKQLASYTGISPIEHTSGSSVYRKPRSRRFGPSRMRKLLYLAAMSVATHNPELRRYYLRKVAEGKPKRLVLNNVANKLLKVVCALVRSESAYIPNYRSVQPMLLKTA